MADLSQGFVLMLYGMGIVFAFLVILMFYIKVVPILSKINISPLQWLKKPGSNDSSSASKLDELNDGTRSNEPSEGNITMIGEKKMKLNAFLANISEQEASNGSGGTKNKISEEMVAAISAAISLPVFH